MGQELRDLIELRRKVRRRIDELRGELEVLEEVLKLIDSIIKSKSITTADRVTQQKSVITISGKGGEWARVTYDDVNLVITFTKPIPEQPHISRFLIGEVLEGLRRDDENMVSEGELDESEALSYDVERDEGGLIKEIRVKNYRSQRRLRRIIEALRWIAENS